MKKYKVMFSGYAYVEAFDEADAENVFDEGLEVYKETSIDMVEEVDEFLVEF
jgi:hypothetical protein